MPLASLYTFVPPLHISARTSQQNTFSFIGAVPSTVFLTKLYPMLNTLDMTGDVEIFKGKRKFPFYQRKAAKKYKSTRKNNECQITLSPHCLQQATTSWHSFIKGINIPEIFLAAFCHFSLFYISQPSILGDAEASRQAYVIGVYISAHLCL